MGPELLNDCVTGAAPTVTAKVSLAEFTPSVTVTVMVEVPRRLVDVTVTNRLEPVPLSTTLASGMTFVSDELLVTVKFASGVSRSPMVKASGPVFVLLTIVWSAISLIVGGYTRADTLTAKDALFVLVPSVTSTVTVDVPV